MPISPVHALLGLLFAGEQYGYELKRRVDQEFSPFWEIDFAQLYRSLAKLTARGWVDYRVQSSAAGPDRKIYALTRRGRAALNEWLSQPAADREEFLVKLRFASQAKRPVDHLLAAQRENWKDEYSRQLAAHSLAAQAGDTGRWVMANAAMRDLEGTSASLAFCEAILTRCRGAMDNSSRSASLRITGSDDPLLARLGATVGATTQVVGSLDGLLALAKGAADVAGVHLLDADTGKYNVPFVRHFFSEEKLVLVNLAVRENGLMLAPGNPKRIRKLRDLTRREVRLINRTRGTGTRHLLALRLRAARVDPRTLEGWERAVITHEAVAASILSGAADAGPGLRAVAAEWGLDFIPLGDEEFDLVLTAATLDSPRARTLFEALHDKEFQRTAAALAGYDLSRSGRVIARVQ